MRELREEITDLDRQEAVLQAWLDAHPE